MSGGHSFDTYYDWMVFPLWLAAGILVFGVLGILIIGLIGICSHSTENVVNLLFHFARVTFGNCLKKKDSNRFTFYYFEVPSYFIVGLSMITAVILGTTFLSFWLSFIVNETFVCDPQLDCFLRDPLTYLVPSSERLDNCTSYDSTNINGTVVCYEFIFDLTKGFSSAVGFMGVAVAYCRSYVFMLILVEKFCCKCCTKYVSVAMQLAICLITLSIVGVVSTVRYFSAILFKSYTSKIIFIVYMVTFILTGPLAGSGRSYYIGFRSTKM